MKTTPSSEKRRIHVFVTGRVQGVSFRFYTRKKAMQLGLQGWVRNLPDGRVEVIAEGHEERLEQLLQWCRQGPSMAQVKEIRADWENQSEALVDFAIRHDSEA